MGTISNQEHLITQKRFSGLTSVKKADFTLNFLVTNGGLMEPEQAKEFWQVAVKGSERLRDWSIIPMKSDTFKIDRFGFTGRVLHAATSGQALPLADRSTPALGQNVLTPKLFRAQANIAQEVFEDNIMQEQLRQMTVTKLADAVRRDMVQFLIQSDTTLADVDLNKFDGVIKRITSNVVDAAGAKLTKSLVTDTFQILPDEYKDVNKLSMVTSTNSWINYMDSLSDRETERAGQIRENMGPGDAISQFRFPIQSEMNYPNNIGSSDNKTSATLFWKKNWHVGLHRDVRVKMDEDITADVFIVVVSVRFDGNFADENGTAQLENVLPS